MIRLKAFRWLKVHLLGYRSFVKENPGSLNTYVVFKWDGFDYQNTMRLDGFKEEWARDAE